MARSTPATFKRMDNDRGLSKVANLRLVDDEWQVAARPAMVWIDEEDGSFIRPTFIYVAGRSKVIRYCAKAEFDVTDGDVLSAILQAMIRPAFLSGGKCRPARIAVDDPVLAEGITQELATIGVECVLRPTLPGVDHVQAWYGKVLTGEEPFPGLLKVEGMSVPSLRRLYELAAEFYRQAPWQFLGDREPYMVALKNGRETRFIVIMGSAGEVFGLSVHDSLEDLHLMYDIFLHGTVSANRTWCVLFFETARAVTFDDLDSIKRYNLPVAAPDAFPVFGRTIGGIKVGPPTGKDLRFMEAALAALNRHILDFLEDDDDLDIWPVDRVIEVELVGGRETILLRGDDDLLPERIY